MNIMRTITLFSLLLALIMVGLPVMGEEKTPEAAASAATDIEVLPPSPPAPVPDRKNVPKTTAELIAEVEAASQPLPPDSAVDENTPKSAAEIMAEIELLSTPTASDSVVEEISSDTAAADNIEELPIDDSPLPDQVIEEYASDDFAADVASAPEVLVDEVASATLFEKADALEPALMIAGTPEDDEGDAGSSDKINGRIIAEKKPLNRRRHLYRWVLKTADGSRIPLKSNIKLLQEVRRENILDSEVALAGKYVQSGYSDKLRYFVVESVVILDEVTSESDDKAAGKKK